MDAAKETIAKLKNQLSQNGEREKTKVSKVNTQTSKIQGKYDKVKEENRNLVKELDKAEKREKAMSAKLSNVQAQLSHAQGKHAKSTEENKKLKDQVAQTLEHKNALKVMVSEANAQLSMVQNQLSLLIKDNQILATELTQYQGRVKAVKLLDVPNETIAKLTQQPAQACKDVKTLVSKGNSQRLTLMK